MKYFKKNKYRKKWSTVGRFVFGFHIICLLVLPPYFFLSPPSLLLLLLFLIVTTATGLGITAGYHRLYSHSSYNLNKIAEGVILFFATMATQGSALKWSYDHRLHHQYTDKEGDPYNIKKGFIYAHILWMFDKQRIIDKKIVPDLLKNRLVLFQDKFYIHLVIFTNTIISLLIGWITADYLGAFIFCWLFRLFVTYHATWFINSAAHYWGEQSYSRELSARDNMVVAFLTFGEGYHNYHHTFPADYRNGVRSLHFDPSKWLIWSLSKVGLASGLKKFHTESIMDKLIRLDTNLLMRKASRLEKNKKLIKKFWKKHPFKKHNSLQGYIKKVSETIQERRTEIKKLIEEYKILRKENKTENKRKRQAIKFRLKRSKRAYQAEWRRWSSVCKILLKTKIMQ